MSDNTNETGKEYPVQRRDVIKAGAGAALLGGVTSQSATAQSASGPTIYVGADDKLYAVDAVTGNNVWSFETGQVGRSSPTVVDGTVYVGSWDNNVYAIDAVTGSKEWSFKTGSRVYSSPTVVDGTVFIGGADNNVYAVDANRGTEEWAFTTGSKIWSSPQVVDGTVYVGSDDRTLYAVDAATGGQEWGFTNPTDRVQSSPTVVDGTVYVGSHDNTLYAVDAATGTEEWTFRRASAGIESSPTVVDGTIFIMSHDNTLYAVDTATGTEAWRFTEPSEGGYSSPTVVDETVYAGSWADTLYAVNATTGTKEWSFTEPSSIISSSPTVWSGTVYVDSHDNTLYAVDAETGSENWATQLPSAVGMSPTVVEDPATGDSVGSRVKLGTLGHHEETQQKPNPGVTEKWVFDFGNNGTNSSPVVWNDTVYIGVRDNKVYGINTNDGTELWHFSTGDSVDSTPEVANNTVYVGSDDGNIYALDASTGSEEWRFPTGTEEVDSSPVVVSGTVYVGSDDNNLYALDANDGTEDWRFNTNDDIYSSPTVVDNTVYIGSLDHNVYAVDASDGTEKWRFQTEGKVFPSPTVVDSTVYITDSDAYQLYALDANNGKEQWRFGLGDQPTSPSVSNGTVYVGAGPSDGNLYAVDATAGTEQWRYQTGGMGTLMKPTIVNNTVYFGSLDNHVYALDASSGSERWSYDVGAKIKGSSPAVVEGTVYVGDIEGSLYALIPPTGTVTGMVTDTDGDPLETVEITFADTNTGMQEGTVTTESNGEYEIDLPAGVTYEATAEKDDFEPGVKTVTVQENETETLSFTLTRLPPDTGTVTGMVTDDGGTRIADVDIYLATADQEYIGQDLLDQYPGIHPPYPSDELSLAASATTDTNGEYTMDNIAPDQYFLLVFPPVTDDYEPILIDEVLVSAGETLVEDIVLDENRPLAPLDPFVNAVFAENTAVLDDSSEAAGEVFLDGAGFFADEYLIDSLELLDYGLGYDLDAVPDKYEDDLAKEAADTTLDVAEHGLDLMLEHLWESLGSDLQDTVVDATGGLQDESWFVNFEYNNLNDLVTKGYQSTSFYTDAESTIDGANSTYDTIAGQEPTDTFSQSAAKKALLDVRRQLRNPEYGVPGVVITPDGETYQFDQTETYQNAYEWTDQRLDEIGTGQTLAQIAQVTGAVVMATGIVTSGAGTVLGAKLLAVGKKSQVALKKAELAAKTKLSAEWVLTQIYWTVDLAESSKVSPDVVNWLDTVTDNGLTEADVTVTNVDMNLKTLPVTNYPYVQANRPTDPPGWFPVAAQWEAVEDATIDIKNNGDESADIRLTMYDQFGDGEDVADRGAMLPEADEDPITLQPGETTSVTLEYSANFDFNPLNDHTMSIDIWADGVRRDGESVAFHVQPGLAFGDADGQDPDSVRVRSPEMAVTTAAQPANVALTKSDLDDKRPSVETILDGTVSPTDTVIETQHTTDGDTQQLQYDLSASGQVALQVLDQDGNMTGYDPAVDEVRTDLPDSRYVGPDATPQTVTASTSPNTTYTVRAVGHRFITDRAESATVQVRETPDRDAILSVTPDETQTGVTPGETDDIEIGIMEAGDQVDMTDVELLPGTFTDGNGNELQDVTITPSDSQFDVQAGETESTLVSFDAADTVPLPGAPTNTRFDGNVTVTTSNAGSIDVSVSALVLSTDVSNARLRGADSSFDGVSLTDASLDDISVPSPKGVKPIEAYGLELTGEGTVKIAVPRPQGVSQVWVYSVDGEWTRLADGQQGDAVRFSVSTDTDLESTVVLAVPAPYEYNVGDVSESGDVGLTDAILIAEEVAGLEPEPFNEELGDLTRDGSVGLSDAILIQEYVAGVADAGRVEISNLDAQDEGGSTLTVTADLDNPGDLGVLQRVEIRVTEQGDDLDVGTTAALEVADIGPGGTETVDVAVDVSGVPGDTYEYGVFSDDDQETGTITVN